jgi:allantoinase
VTYDLVVRGDDLHVGVVDGLIAEVGTELGAGREEIDARGLLVLPGMVDAHVHLNDPGRAHWEGFATGTAALAAGGVTCAIDMPLNAHPPTIDATSFDAKVDAARGRARVDFALWGGIVPGDVGRLDELAERGVVGFKAFMCPTGIDDFEMADPDTLGRGMERAAALGLPVAVHAEDPAVTEPLTSRARAEGRTGMRDYLASRPVEAEVNAIRMASELASQTGCSLHVVHVSSGAGVREVAEARARGADVTCETCPHYLVLHDDDAVSLGAVAKCGPPLRPVAESEELWRLLASGDIDLVASDHSPCPPDMKDEEDAFVVWGGIAGAQTTLALLHTHGPGRGLSPARLAALLSATPASRFGLAGKGAFVPGGDADIVLVDVGPPWTLTEENLVSRHSLSPFVGQTLRARVTRTIVRGVTVWADGAPVGAGHGRLVTPKRAVGA